MYMVIGKTTAQVHMIDQLTYGDVLFSRTCHRSDVFVPNNEQHITISKWIYHIYLSCSFSYDHIHKCDPLLRNASH